MRNKRLENKKKIAIMCLSIILIISSVITIKQNLSTQKIIEEKTLESYFIVSDQAGIGIIPGVVFFGRMTPGGSGTAKIYLNNTYKREIGVDIKAIGKIKNYFNEQKIIVGVEENKEISLTVKVPLGTSHGEYRGKIVVTIRSTI